MFHCLSRIGGIVLCLLIASCTIESPKAPNWTVPINMPLIDSTYTIVDLVDSYENAFIFPDGLLGLRFESELDTTRLGDYLQIADVSDYFKVGLSDFYMDSIKADADLFTFRTIHPPIEALQGKETTLDPFMFVKVPSNNLQHPDFRYASIMDGQAFVTITNHLPVDLEQVVIELVDPETNESLLISDPVPYLSARSSYTLEMDVNTLDLPATAQWFLSGQSPASPSEPIFIDSNQTVELELQLTELYVDQLNARLPSLKIDHKVAINMGQDFIIEQLNIQSGTMIFEIRNDLPVSLDLNLSSANIFNRQKKDTLAIPIHLDANQTSRYSFDLASYEINLMDEQGSTHLLPFHIQGGMVDIPPGIVDLDVENNIRVDIMLKDIQFGYFSGRLNHYKINLDSTQTTIDLEDFGDLEGLKVNDARLNVTLYSTLNLPVEFVGNIYAFNKKGESTSLYLNHPLKPSRDRSEVATVFPPFTPFNSNILLFINLNPTFLLAAGHALIGDGSRVGDVYADDYIRANFTFETPAKAVLERRQIDIDTTRIHVLPPGQSQSDRSDVIELEADWTENVHDLLFTIRFTNHLPVGGEMTISIADNLEDLNQTPDLVLGPIDIGGAPLDAGGRVENDISKDTELKIPADKISLFRNERPGIKTLYAVVDLEIKGSNKESVQVYGSDYMNVQAALQVNVAVKGD